MKKFFSLMAAVLFAGSMMAGTYSFTFAKGDLTSSDTEFTYDGVTWTLSAPETQWNGVEGKTGYLFGSKNSPVTLTVSTSGISGTITKVAVVGRSNNANKTAVVSVKVGSTDFTSGNASWDNGDNQTVSFTGSAEGALAVTITPDACGIILAGITVYTDGEGGGSGEGGEEEDEVCSVTGTGKWAFVESSYSFYTDGSVDINLFTTAGWFFDEEGYLYGEGAGAAVVFDIIPENQADLAGTYTVKDGTIDPKYCFIAEYATADDEEGTTYEIADGTITISLNAGGTAYTLVYDMKLSDDSEVSGVVEGLCLVGGAEEQGIEDVVLTEKAKKVVVDGNVFVIRDNKMFNVTGTRVR